MYILGEAFFKYRIVRIETVLVQITRHREVAGADESILACLFDIHLYGVIRRWLRGTVTDEVHRTPSIQRRFVAGLNKQWEIYRTEVKMSNI